MQSSNKLYKKRQDNTKSTMNLSLKIFLLACAGGFSSIHAAVVEESEHPEFFAWAKQHSKAYDSDDETLLRLGIWKDNNGEH